MYTILNKKGEPVVFQKFNFHGLVYLSNTTKMNMIVYKNNMIFLSGIYIPKKDYTCKFVDINSFINYNEVSSIVDCTDFMVENKYQSSIKIDNYKNEYHTDPNLELIVYGKTPLMHSKYCPLKRLNMCGECKKRRFAQTF